MEPGADFPFRQNGLVSGIDLHGELQSEWWVLEVLCCLLKPLQIKGVVKGAHVQQYGDAMLVEGLGSFLAHQSLQSDVKCCGPWSGPVIVHGWWEGALPLVEEGFPHSAPHPVQHTG